MPATPRHLAAAGYRGRQADQEDIQSLPDQFLPRRDRRGSDGDRKPYLYVGIDRTSKYAFTQLVDKATTATARTFLYALVAAVPYKVRIILTDNGI